MNLAYNNFSLTNLGEVTLTQKREYEGGEAPHRAKVTLGVKLALFERTYANNYALLEAARKALAAPNAMLIWQLDDGGDRINQTATLMAQDLPEEWGTYYQEMNLSFCFYENLDTSAQNIPLTFVKAGGVAPINFSVVTGWSEGGSTERFSSLRSQRKETHGRLEVRGLILADTTLGLADRRTALAAQVAALRAAMNAAEGQLTFGTGAMQMFDGLVRVEQFKAEVNQAVSQIEFTFTASYTLFPNEKNYATVEATISEADNFQGEVTLTVTGKIEATDEVTARAKLAALTGAILKQYGYAADPGVAGAAAQQLELNTTPNLISANADGDTFTELAFAGRWRRARTTNQLATYQRTGGSEPVSFGTVRTWSDHYAAQRFDELRDQRKLATDVIELAGTFMGDLGLDLTTRRAALLAKQRAMKAEVASSSGTLAYGDFSEVVRVDEFKAEINQAETGIDWSCRVHYTLFPNEDSYAMVEATFSETDSLNGEFFLSASGRIQAVDEATARAKLATVLAAGLQQYGYAAPGVAAQQLESSATPNLIDADADGVTFTELTFTARWRRWKATNQAATFQAQGLKSKAQSLGNVRQWVSSYAATRFNLLRGQREHGVVSLEAGGTYAGDLALAVEDRRTQLIALQVAMQTAVNCPAGTLAYGKFSQTVRVDEFKAEINQAETGIEWTLRAHYTVFPDETTYATCEATAEEKDNFMGELTLSVAGRIQAASETVARTKLAAVLAAFIAQYGYGGSVTSPSQQVELASTANLISANADGDTFTELSFSGSWRKWAATNQTATFRATGNKTAPIPFGCVKFWEVGYKAERFDVQRSERRHSTGTISANGTFPGDPKLTLKDRRAALLAMQRKMTAEVNNAEGTLIYGDQVQVVRVEEFVARVNQAMTGIDWSFTASYSLFPNEGGYATAEFTADTRNDVETGDSYLSFAGEILAPNGSLARAKLNTLRTATLAVYGFAAGQQVRSQNSTHEISANGDATSTVAEGMETQGDAAGVSFLRLNFNEEYRQRMPGTILSSQFTISSRDDTTTNLLMTTYAGTVTATGNNADAATAAALLRAAALGGGKEQTIDATAFLKSQSMVLERRQTSDAVAQEFTRLQFSYEYQSKLTAGRAYLELNTQTLQDAFGPDAESVSGFIVARDFLTAQAIYQQQVKGNYTTRLVRSETVTQSQVQAETPSGLEIPVDTFVFNTQMLRLEFAFTAHKDKPMGRVTARYAISVTRDFRSLRRTSRLRGSVYAFNRAAADTFVTALAAPFGQLMGSSRDEDHDFTPEADVFTKLDFDDQYEDRLTGVSGLIEMHVTETVTYTAIRWAMQAIPFQSNGSGGVSIPQATGLTEASRSIRGSVTAGTLPIARQWAMRHRGMLTGDMLGNNCPTAEKWETDFDLAPRVDGIVEDGLAGSGSLNNVQMYRVGFEFGELLPYYPAPT